MYSRFFIIFLYILPIVYCGCDRTGSQQAPEKKKIRLVASYRPASNLIAALKMTQYIVGVPNKGRSMPLLNRLYPAIASLPEVGSKAGVNIETIIGLHPVLAVLHPGRMSRKLVQQLHQFGIQSYVAQLESISDIQEALRELGQILHIEKKAKASIQAMEQILRLAKENAVKQNQRSVYFASSRSIFTTQSNSMLQHEMIIRANAHDVVSTKKGGWINVSLEQILNWNPDIIIISGYARYSVQSILQDTRFQSLKAVKTKHVYRMPEKKIVVWDFPGPDSVLGILWLARICYPEKYKKMDWKQVKENYYRKVYGISYQDMVGD